MKLLLVFAFLALICMARSAPTSSTTQRELILPDYFETDDEDIDRDEILIDAEDDEEEVDTTTTTTTTTRRSPYAYPTRNRNLIPSSSRRPFPNERTTYARTTTTTTTAATVDADVEENDDSTNAYDGDFKYVKDFRKYIQKLLEDIRKLIQNLSGYNYQTPNQNQRQQYNQDGDYE